MSHHEGQPLRERAEEVARGLTDPLSPDTGLSPDQVNRLFHELQVQQIELQLQNDEMRRVQAELEVSRARYFDLYHLAPTGYLTLDDSGVVLEANLTVARMLGVARGELMGQDLNRYIHPSDQDPFYLRCRGLWKTGAPQAFELQMVRADGASRVAWAELNEDQDDNTGGGRWCRMVLADITDRSHTALLETNRRLLDSREAERVCLARELHDGVLQDLIAIGFSLAEVRRQIDLKNPLPAAELAQQLQFQVRQGVRQLREVVNDLRPAGLEEFGLAPSLEGLVAKLTRESPNPPKIQLGLENIPELRPPQRLCFYRIGQEALHNCLRHAHAKKVTVKLRRVGSEAELVVQDNGRGFAVPESLLSLTALEHYGLAGMSERAELSGALLSIRSSPGKGTKVRVTTPLKP